MGVHRSISLVGNSASEGLGKHQGQDVGEGTAGGCGLERMQEGQRKGSEEEAMGGEVQGLGLGAGLRIGPRGQKMEDVQVHEREDSTMTLFNG